MDILKICAAILGIISGLIGTLTNTKDKQTGEVTPWGKYLVAVIVLSGLITALSQWYESKQKQKADLAGETKLQTIINSASDLQRSLSLQSREFAEQREQLTDQSDKIKTATKLVERSAIATTASLQNTLRLSDPFQDPRFVDLYLTVDGGSPITNRYFSRLRGLYGISQGDIVIDKGESSFPNPADEDERFIYLASTFGQAEIDFSKKNNRTRYLDAICRREGKEDNRLSVNLAGPGYFFGGCVADKIRSTYQSGNGFESLRDLSGANVTIKLADEDQLDFKKVNAMEKLKMNLSVRITEPNGKVLVLDNLPAVHCESICFGGEVKASDLR